VKLVAGLNGVPLNGSAVAPSLAPHDWLQEPDPAWPPAGGTWPATAADEFESERRRLESEIAVATERAAVARQRAIEREAEMRAALREILVASQERVAEIEREHESALAVLRQQAQDEAARILADARRELAERNRRVSAVELDEVRDAR
jgi:hypothetical protein